MLKIKKVQRNSIGAEIGLEVGDEIVAFDGHAVEDELDYLYYCSKECFTMTVKDGRTGEEVETEIEKDEDEELGLTFEKNTKIRTCHNRCVFCFVDQMPKGMRESLYIKDDDPTMSFTCGNFVTLTNLTDEGLERIVRLKLSPLYISVHTMNKQLRVKLLRNRFAGNIVEQIKTLAEHGIEMHCQAVLVPNENDGEELAYTARELFKYYPTVKDLACVPTGLTKYREGLTEIPDIDKAYSEKLLDLVDSLNEEFGVNFLLPADEYFVKAERALKSKEFYGNFEQIENGIGLTTKFQAEAYEALSKQGKIRLSSLKTSVLVTGVSAAKINAPLYQSIENSVDGLTIYSLPVVNEFFGSTVTCTGLLTGKDMVKSLEEFLKERSADEVIIASNTMKEFEEVFLCGMTLKEFKKALKRYGVKVKVNAFGGEGLIKILSENKE